MNGQLESRASRDATVARRFPIQGQWSNAKHRRIPDATIPWAVAEEAYAVYAALFSNGQSLERLAERGGFGRDECAWLLAGAPKEWKILDPGHVTLPDEAPRV